MLDRLASVFRRRRPRILSREQIVAMLPSASQRRAAPRGPVDVIVPVYRGLAETKRCIESVLAAACGAEFRLVLVDDCSPDPAIVELLQATAKRERVALLRNTENLGFVATVNRAMRYAADRDVVLLNSDTEVADGWLDRILAHAAADPRIATITPFSNNATVCSYPTRGGHSTLPPGETVATMDRAFAGANPGRTVDLVSGVGFCMYIRRSCLDEIGDFDVAAFGRGYGEECDFCLRAASKGWRNILAADVFVFHAGEVSFGGEAGRRRAHAQVILGARYPSYHLDVSKFIAADPALPLRVAATAARYRLGGKPVVLLVTHRRGGGTEKHVAELVARFAGQVRFLRLQPVHGYLAARARRDLERLFPPREAVELRAVDEGEGLSLLLPMSSPDDVAALVRSFGVGRIHVHQLVDLPAGVADVVKACGLPVDYTVHDYYAMCPRITFTRDAQGYCGEPDESACERCLVARPRVPGANEGIRIWRERHAWLFRQAENVICPSQDVAARVTRYFPRARTAIVYHEAQQPLRAARGRARKPAGAPGAATRVAVIGAISLSKGAAFLAACAREAQRRKVKMQFRVIGAADFRKDPGAFLRVPMSGPYGDAELPALIDRSDPHLIFFPARWPETYSYTLSVAIASGRPILAPDLGSFPERLAGLPWCWLYGPDMAPGDVVALIDRLRRQHIEPGAEPVPPPYAGVGATASEAEQFYPSLYGLAPRRPIA